MGSKGKSGLTEVCKQQLGHFSRVSLARSEATDAGSEKLYCLGDSPHFIFQRRIFFLDIFGLKDSNIF